MREVGGRVAWVEAAEEVALGGGEGCVSGGVCLIG